MSFATRSFDKKNGFTLIELLIVVAIIGILAGIVTIVFGGSQQKARDARRKADVRTIYDAASTYAIVNGGKFYKYLFDDTNRLKRFTSTSTGVEESTSTAHALCSSAGNDPNVLIVPGTKFAPTYSSMSAVDLRYNWDKLESEYRQYLVNGVLPVDPRGRCKTAFTPDNMLAKERQYLIRVRGSNHLSLAVWTYLENTEDPDRNGALPGLYRGVLGADYYGVTIDNRDKASLYAVGSPRD